jgi:hypothetical protein
MESSREDFEKIVNEEQREQARVGGMEGVRGQAEVEGDTNVVKWWGVGGGSEGELQCVLYGLLTFVHEMYAARTHT